MQKVFMLIFLSFFVFGIALNSPIILAGDDNSDDDKDDSDRVDEDKEDERRDRFKEEIKREFIDEDGRKIKIERKIEIKDGKIIVKIKRKIIDADGREREFEIEIENRDGIKKKIKIKLKNSTEEFEVETELELDDEFEGNESDLGAITSDGKRHKIKVLPDRVFEIAIERLKAKNFTIELKEILHKNIPRVIYNIEANKSGRFLGIFKLKIKVEGQIDPETGEVIGINKPWWAFLVTGEDSDQTGTNGEEEANDSSNETTDGNEESEGNETNTNNTNITTTN